MAGGALAIGGLAAPALASPAVPASHAAHFGAGGHQRAAIPPPVGTYKLCLVNDTSLCAEGQGHDNPMIVVRSGYSTFTLVVVGGHDAFKDQSGNFVRAQTGGPIVVGTTCNPTDYNCQWTPTGTGNSVALQNVGTLGTMKSISDSGGSQMNWYSGNWRVYAY